MSETTLAHVTKAITPAAIPSAQSTSNPLPAGPFAGEFPSDVSTKAITVATVATMLR